jgi:hypothetical protein
MSYYLFLDDIRMPADAGNYMYPVELRTLYRTKEWVIVRNYKDFVETVLSQGIPEMVSFDHDLALIHYDPSTWKESFSYQEETGLDCAKWLCDYCQENNLPLPQYLVHSANPVGKENIVVYLERFKKFCDENNSAG